MYRPALCSILLIASCGHGPSPSTGRGDTMAYQDLRRRADDLDPDPPAAEPVAPRRKERPPAPSSTIEARPGPELIAIPAARIRLGATDLGPYPFASPVREVEVHPFWIDRREVTVADYAACVDDGRCTPPATGEACNWGLRGRDDHPVNCLAFAQAEAYCAWAQKRLPAEDEWELAARGSDFRKYPWGNQTPDRGVCWGRRGTCRAGASKLDVSPYGVVDLAGNVAEWTAGEYCTSGDERCTGSAARATRGGAFSVPDTGMEAHRSYLRTAHRSPGGAPSPRIGVRCARD
jgi:formylglycine-generating enzyme required for sulfatase activity